LVSLCGIAGWFDLRDDLSGKKMVIGDMCETLANRGPDEEGFWLNSHVAFGHKRLAVIDPEGGQQPMVRRYGDNAYVITYNGELYNTQELRKELENLGHRFTTDSDTEVLLVSFVQWGPKCVEYLNGIFAFGIWDGKEKQLFLARDRFGVKPLFYALRGGGIIFASELKAILAHPAVKAEIDRDGLSEVFSLGPSRTPGSGVFKDVFEVKPAHCLLFNGDGCKTWRYWQLTSEMHTDSLAETVEKVRFLVTDSIKRQLVSDVPVCTFLSGGLDSSTITALAARHFHETGKGRLHTYSIDYADNDKFFRANLFQPDSDNEWIRLVSETFGTEHHRITVGTTALAEALEDALIARDLPGMADIDSSLLLFCREVKKRATVALSGECADEIFGGYPWFHRPELADDDSFPWIRSKRLRARILSRETKALIDPEAYIKRRLGETLKEVPRLAGEGPDEAKRRELFYLNMMWFMATLLDRKDRMSMAAGLEVRVPFCDHRLVQYVWNIPWEMKMLGGREKGILRKAMEGVLPGEVLQRKKSPFPKTFHPEYERIVGRRLEEILHDPASPILDFIDKEEVLKLIREQPEDDSPWFGQLMAKAQLLAYLIQVNLWLEKYKIAFSG